MTACGISRWSRRATPTVVKEFSHEGGKRYDGGSTYVAVGRIPRFCIRCANNLGSKRSKEGFFLPRHLIRHCNDDRISLIYRIQQPFNPEAVGSTLIAHVMARPIPARPSSQIGSRVGYVEEQTCVARGWLDNDALSGNKSALLLRSKHHGLGDSILD